jgi:hypothetical protein
MHDLERCALTVRDRATVVEGYVAAFDGETMTVAAEHGVVPGGVRPGDDVQVLVLDEVRGEVRYVGTVSRVGASTVALVDLELVSMLQKRQGARDRTLQLCTGVATGPDGAGPGRPISFVVGDISAHGMRLSTTSPLAVHDRVAFEFPTGRGAVKLDAEVLRTQRTSTGGTQYGCRFVDIRESDVDALVRLVLRTQGAQRRMRLDA